MQGAAENRTSLAVILILCHNYNEITVTGWKEGKA
jgi:hypothetical protein